MQDCRLFITYITLLVAILTRPTRTHNISKPFVVTNNCDLKNTHTHAGHTHTHTHTGEMSYLQTHSDPLSESTWWKRCLHHGNCLTAQDPTLWTHVVTLLLDPRHHRKVLWEIPGDDPADTLLLQLNRAVQLCEQISILFNTTKTK